LSFVAELKRRNVFKVTAAYGVLGWLIIQVVDTLAPRMGLPEWVPGFFIVLVLVGFPVAVFLTWAFEMTPDGVRRTEDVDPEATDTAAAGHGIHYVIIAGLVALVLVQQFAPRMSELNPFRGERSSQDVAIAVLPFADLSSAGDQEYLGDGVAEEILNVLASLEGLSVTSRTSSFAFKAQNRPIPEIAEVLGVTHVVEGSIRKQDDRVRITAQLIEVASDSHLWSDTYDATLEDIFSLEDEIAGEISGALSDRLNLALPDVQRDTPAWNPVAHELYLRARKLLVARTGYEEAIQLAESALLIEPDFTDAYALIAMARSLVAYDLGIERSTWALAFATYDQAWVAASHAVGLDPGHPLGLAVQGLIRLNQKRWIESRVYLERAVRVPDPDPNAFLWLGILEFQMGETIGAFETMREGLLAYPNEPNLLRWIALQSAAEGNWDEAWRMSELPSALGISGSIATRKRAGVETGQIPLNAYLDWVSDLFDEVGLSSAEVQQAIGVARALVTSDPALQRDTAVSVISNSLTGDTGLLTIFSTIDRPDISQELFRIGLPDILEGPNQSLMSVFWTPEKSSLRQEADVRQALLDLGLLEYWQLFGWPDVCRPVGLDDFACDSAPE
jgi:TolB-like protein